LLLTSLFLCFSKKKFKEKVSAEGGVYFKLRSMARMLQKKSSTILFHHYITLKRGKSIIKKNYILFCGVN